jgi:hypothetical protein
MFRTVIIVLIYHCHKATDLTVYIIFLFLYINQSEKQTGLPTDIRITMAVPTLVNKDFDNLK